MEHAGSAQLASDLAGMRGSGKVTGTQNNAAILIGPAREPG